VPSLTFINGISLKDMNFLCITAKKGLQLFSVFKILICYFTK